MPGGDISLSGGADDDDLLADANALLADDPAIEAPSATISKKKKTAIEITVGDLHQNKKVAIKRDTALPVSAES